MEVATVAIATHAIMWSSIRNAAFEIHTNIFRPANYDPTPKPNFVSYIHPCALTPSWPPRYYAMHMSYCRGSRRIKTQTERGIAFYVEVREKEREREGNEDKKRMVRGTTSLLEIIDVVVCECTKWDPFGGRRGYSIVTFFKHWWCHQHLK